MVKQASILFVGFLLCLLLVVKNLTPSAKLPLHAHKPQEYMQQVLVWQYTKTGSLKHYISAKQWSYLPQKKSSHLNSPNLILYKPNLEQWFVQADDGLVHHKTLNSAIEKIDLIGHVHINRKASKTWEPISLSTAQLAYHPKTQALSSTRFVTLNRPNLKITGIGLIGNLKTNYLQLQKNVKTEYKASA